MQTVKINQNEAMQDMISVSVGCTCTFSQDAVHVTTNVDQLTHNLLSSCITVK